jgi:hypothetical protein
MSMLVADFYKGTKRKPCVLDISRLSDSSSRQLLETVAVADKREARKIAAERGAKCWNF